MARNIIELYLGQFSTVTLSLNSSSLIVIRRALANKIKQSALFLQNEAIVLAFTPQLEKIDLIALTKLLNQYHIYPLGVCGWQNSLQKELIISAGLTPLDQSKQTSCPLPDYRYIPPMIIRENITSKRRIYAKNQDLIILGNVEKGSEIAADGNIHIYGKLQGRVVAGINNSNNVMIFTQYLDAEFISINHHFLYQKQIPTKYITHPCKIEANKSGLLFFPFNLEQEK